MKKHLNEGYLGEIRKQNLTCATSENIPHAPGLRMLTVFFKDLWQQLEAQLLEDRIHLARVTEIRKRKMDRHTEAGRGT